MKKILILGLLLASASAHAGIVEDAGQAERQATTYYVEKCRAHIAGVMKAGGFGENAGVNVDTMLANFSNQGLVDGFLRSADRHAGLDSATPSVLQQRMADLREALSIPDAAQRCSRLGAMFDVYRAVAETHHNIAADKQAADERNLQRAHANDAVMIDYTLLVQAIGQQTKQARPAKGSVRKLTVGQYVEWEKATSKKWKDALWSAIGIRNKNSVYSQCLTSVNAEWTSSFGYPDTVLRSEMFVGGALRLDKVLRIVCQPG